MYDYYKVADLSEFSDRNYKIVHFMQKEVALLRHEGVVYAIDNLCPHLAAPLIMGQISNGVLTCPRHGARFELATGKGLAGAYQTDIGCYPVKIDGTEIKLGIKARQ